MARTTDKLTAVAVKIAKPAATPQKLADGGGMFLLVTPDGSKYWRLAYRFAGKQQVLALGVYPDVSLLQAREKRKEAREALLAGSDPMLERKRAKSQLQAEALSTFEIVARDWYSLMETRWTPQHAQQTMASLEAHIFPHLGSLPITAITAKDMIRVLKLLEGTQRLETLRRVYQRCGAVFRYALDLGRIPASPMPSTTWFKTPVVVNHARLADGEVQKFYKNVELANIQPQTRLALKLMALVFLRTGELRLAEWSHIDFDRAEWFVPAENTKMKRPHVVPLSEQALSLLRQMRQMTGNWKYIFAGRDPRKPMSSGTLITAIYRMGLKGETTVHGFRGTASTILNEEGFLKDAIERQLAHSDKDRISAAYNHAEHLEERRKMMNWWGNYLEGGVASKILSKGTEVDNIKWIGAKMGT